MPFDYVDSTTVVRQCKRMDDLPVVWVQQILHFVSITDLIVCKSVSTLFREAATRVMEKRNSLMIGNYIDQPSKKHAKLFTPLDCVSASHGMAERQMHGLLLLRNLQHLCTFRCSTHRIMDLIEQNANTLTWLSTDWWPPLRSLSGNHVAYPKLTHLSCPYFDSATSAACPQLYELNISGEATIRNRPAMPDILMPLLNKLTTYSTGSPKFNKQPKDVNRFIMKNAATLESLYLPGGYLPFHRIAWVFPYKQPEKRPVPQVVYSCLKQVTCTWLDETASAACPVLEKLRVSEVTSPLTLAQLPPDTMRKLSFGFVPESRSQIQEIVNAIFKFTNLTKLCVRQNSSRIRDECTPFHDEDYESFSMSEGDICPLFGNLHNLSKLRNVELMMSTDSNIGSFDSLIRILADTKPNLEKLKISGSTMRRAGLESLSELPHLTSLSLEFPGLTADDVVYFLQGRLRHVLLYLRVDSHVCMRPVRREVKQVNMERMGSMMQSTAISKLIFFPDDPFGVDDYDYDNCQIN